MEVVELEAKLTDFMAEGRAYNPDFRVKNHMALDENMIKRLKALGYVD